MRFVCDCCNDLTNIEADRMEIQIADLDQIMLAKLTKGREEK